MVGSRDVLSPLRAYHGRIQRWLDADEYALVKLVVGVSLFALVLRLVFLGARPAHFDEGRVAYWALHYGETGSFAYRRIIHGPFIQHVDRYVFAALGPNDFTMRLPVAVVGSLLPLTALLFRAHLRETETVAMALLLAVNPVVLFYSRFMRSDVLVAAFMFAAFGLLVRFYDTRRPRYLYAVAFFMALGFASKENAIVYVLTWFGALGLLLAKVFVLPNGYRETAAFLWAGPSLGAVRHRVVGRFYGGIHTLVEPVRAFRRRHDSPASVLGAYAGHVALAALLFLVVSLFFYAPRGAGLEGLRHPPAPPSEGAVGFWQGVFEPRLFPQMVEATLDRVVDQYGEWFEPASEKTPDNYRRHLGTSLKALGFASAPLLAFSVFGFALDRLGVVRARHLVPFVAYGGFVSIFGYPAGTDIGAPWLVTHAVVPLALPAGVGLAAVFRWGVQSLEMDDVVGVAITGLVVVLVTVLVANVAVTNVYLDGTADENPLVQFAQPEESTRAALETMDRVATANANGTDVVVYHGEKGDAYDENEAFVEQNRSEWDDSYWNLDPTCMRWYNALPIPWYFAAKDVQTACENSPTALGVTAMTDRPPMILTQDYDSTVPKERLRENGYTGKTYRLRTSGYKNVFTVWVHESYR